MTQTYQPQPQPQPEPPKKKRRWLLWTLIIAGLLWLVSCGAIIAALGEDEDTTTAQPTPSPTVAPSKAPKPEAEASQPTTVQIGEKVRDGDYQFVVSKIRCGVRQIGDTYSNEKAQGQFCLVSMKIKNVGRDPIDFSDENQALVDTKGKQYSPDDDAWVYMENPAIYEEINPGNTLKAVVPFDIAKKAKPDYLLLKAGTWGFSEGVRVKL